jgi:transposase
MPPWLGEWLPEDHLAWLIVDAVEGVDLEAFCADCRAGGHGAAAYEPSVMVALVLYACATKQRSSRAIECHCRQEVAYRVVAANRVPTARRSPVSSSAARRRWASCSARCRQSARRPGW